jgi:hypothetical protein
MVTKWFLISLALAALARAQGDNETPTLDPQAIQSGSFTDGRNSVGADEANQSPSATSKNNFINFCKGKTLTNGLQFTTGSCNGIGMLTSAGHRKRRMLTYFTR